MLLRQNNPNLQRSQGRSERRTSDSQGVRCVYNSLNQANDRHTAPVWQLSWAHPSFGSILASSSYDGRVFIWKEVGAGQSSGSGGELQDGWERIKEHTLHTASGECQL